jgi:hypothetical protein
MQERSPPSSNWWRHMQSLGNKSVKAPKHVQCVSLIRCAELSEQMRLSRGQDCCYFVHFGAMQRLRNCGTHQALGQVPE